MTTLQRVQNMSKALLTDGRKYVDDMEWLNARLLHQDSRVLGFAARELVIIMSRLARYSDIPIGNVFKVLAEAHAELGSDCIIGRFVTDDYVEDGDECPAFKIEIDGAVVLCVTGESE